MVMIGVLHFYVNVCINIKISLYFMEMLSNLFNEFGRFGPITLIFISMYLLWNKHNLFFYYTIGVFIDNILNLILKGLFLQPRPNIDRKEFDLVLKHGKRFIFKDGMPYDLFGMPSGHAQSSLFSTVFIYLCLRKNNIGYTYLAISLLTMLQRVVYNQHSILQVCVGAIIGCSTGYLFYYMANEKVKGLIREKPDDFGPI
jgi:membrane-associated phospholipid phosphatase